MHGKQFLPENFRRRGFSVRNIKERRAKQALNFSWRSLHYHVFPDDKKFFLHKPTDLRIIAIVKAAMA